MLKNKQSILKLLLILICIGIQNANAQVGANTGVDDSGKFGTLTVVGIVLLVVAILYLILKRLGYFITKATVKSEEIQEATSSESDQDRLTGEINAAIVMALYLYTSEIHDQEDPVITMIRVSRTYSPWSSKIYGLRKLPR